MANLLFYKQNLIHCDVYNIILCITIYESEIYQYQRYVYWSAIYQSAIYQYQRYISMRYISIRDILVSDILVLTYYMYSIQVQLIIPCFIELYHRILRLINHGQSMHVQYSFTYITFDTYYTFHIHIYSSDVFIVTFLYYL